jgi:hypothetical protein
VCDVAGAAGLKLDATIKFGTTRRTWRDTAARNNQIEDDVEDVERYCGNCAVPSEPAPRRTLVYCHVLEARDQEDRSNSSTRLQFNEALKPPAGHISEKMHTTKRSRFSVPWMILPPPSQSEVDCGVFEKCERADPWKWTTRSPIGHAFHPP